MNKLKIRDKSGRFVSQHCPDPNCSGELVYEDDKWFGPQLVCDGLTHDTDTGPLRACEYSIDTLKQKV